MNVSQAPADQPDQERNSPGDAADATATSPLERLGASLRDARQQRGLSLGDLASQLHMGVEQLQALENAESSRLPEQVFVIAQARRVAAALGVEVDALVEPLKQQGFRIKAAPAPLSQSPGSSGSQRRPARLSAQSYTRGTGTPRSQQARPGRWVGSLALLAGLVAAGSWGWQQRTAGTARLSARLSSAPQAKAAQGQPQRPSQAAPAALTPPTRATAPKPVVPSKPAIPAKQELQLSSSQSSWLEVRSSGGQKLFEGTFKGRRRFPLGKGLDVLAGRPDLVQTRLNGGPLRTLGPIDQIRWVRFTPTTTPAR